MYNMYHTCILLQLLIPFNHNNTHVLCFERLKGIIIAILNINYPSFSDNSLKNIL